VRSYDGRVRAVDGINLSVGKGEFVTFLGPSGSGKTTTLMMLAGFEEPDAGRISLAGKDITHVRSWKRNIGVVFQNYALFPHMSVRKNVAFPLNMRKVDAATIERKTNDVLKLVGLSEYSERYPTQLSGGQQQRVALARGLVFEPDVLLLDEPLGALDKNLREHMQVELKRIHREVGVTMIYVTHDQSEAMTMSDRVVVFRGGQIEQSGGPIELYDYPRTRFVAEFIGNSNILDLSAVDEAGKFVKSTSAGTIRTSRFNPNPPGGARYLLLRPEEITVSFSHPDPSVTLENRVAVQISTLIQYGNESILIGTLPGSDVTLRARVGHQVGRTLPEQGIAYLEWPKSAGYVI
jgi:putative spermidine/putrescine transport system ATP-binding protein